MRPGIIILLIVSTGIVIYSNSLGGGFLWDDVVLIPQNDFIKNIALAPKYFVLKDALARGTLAGENYRPFLTLSYAVDYFFWKLNPLGYHISNLFFHISNAVLVFFLFLLITKSRFISAFTSFFFLTHPVQTESVAWISGRADVLFLFFYLLAFIAYLNYTRRKRLIFYLASLLFFLCSLLSKEMAASFPLIIILYDLFYTRREKISQRAIRYFPFFLLLEGYVFLRFTVIGKLAQCDYWTGDMYTTFLSMARGVVYYIRLLVYPVGLCADYLTFPKALSIKAPWVIFSIMTITLLITVALMLRRKQKHISFSIFLFFVTLLPAANIIPINILIAERFLYLPSIGYFFAVAALLALLFDKFAKRHLLKYSVGCLGGLLVLTYSSLTIERNLVWADDFAFYKDIAKRYPDNYRAYYGLAYSYYNLGYTEKAYKNAKKALGVAPKEYPSAMALVARYYRRNKRYDEAITEYRRILKSHPDMARIYRDLASVYARQEKYDLAHKELKKALALDPHSFDTRIAMADLCLQKGDTENGINMLNEILSEPPLYHRRTSYARGYFMLGDLYLEKEDIQNAIRAWQRAYEDFEDQPWFHEISAFLIGKKSLRETLLKTNSWEPEYRITAYYYAGIKKEMEGDAESAIAYYRKSAALTSQMGMSDGIQIRAAKRAEELEKKSKGNSK